MSRVGCVVFPELPPTKAGEPLPATLVELFFRLSPVVATRQEKPVAVFLDFRGIDTEELGFEKRLELKVSALVSRWSGEDSPPSFRIGLAENASFAFLHAFHPEGLETRLSPRILEDLLDPFRVARPSKRPITGQIGAWMKLLQKLGIHTLREFSLLPPSAIASRFGKSGVEFSRRIQESTQSADSEAWPLFVPSERLIETQEYDPDRALPALLDPILFASKELFDRLSARLRARMLRATSIQITLRHEGGISDERSIAFCTPQGTAAGMLPSFREHLAQWLALTESEDSALYGRDVIGLTIEVLETAPGHRSQRDLFHNHEDQAESWDSLLARLSKKMGQSARFQIQSVERHLPEKSWIPCEPAFRANEAGAVSGIAPDPQLELFVSRPTRLLRESMPLEHRDGWLRWPETNGTPGRRKCVLKWIGPERICEGWWEAQGVDSQRDYFRVICQGGIQIWGYFEPSSGDSSGQPQLFHLQGYFD